jgi:indolepyruvate ferredoxin oxidoreductase alpha subunit
MTAMANRVVNGDEAFVQGCLDAGVRVVASYPGSPSSGVVERLAHLAGERGMHVEWSTNERVAFEVAVGASIAGARSLAAMKGVGLNVALDPVMVANLCGVNAGLVILLGDDPGAWASQNDQDSRALVAFAELPLLEPSSLAEGYAMIRDAFALSERFSLPVVIREVRRYAEYREEVAFPEEPLPTKPISVDIAADRAARRWIPSTDNAVRLHRLLHEKLERIALEFGSLCYNAVVGHGVDGVIACGFADRKARDVLARWSDGRPFRWFRLGTLNPLPKPVLGAFLRSVERVLILEEGEPFVERHLKAMIQELGHPVWIHGKDDGTVAREGELFGWQIAEAFAAYSPGCLSTEDYDRDGELAHLNARRTEGKPPGYLTAAEGLCDGCPYTPTFEALRDVLHERGEDAIFLADPGCGVRLRVAPFQMLDVKYSLSSCIGIATGIARTDATKRVIAFPGDSAFFHSGITDLINAAYNRVRVLVLVLDNGTTALSGFEPHPGVGLTATGSPARVVGIEDLARACQIDFVRTVNPRDPEAIRQTFREALAWDDLAVVVARDPCPFIEFHRPKA